MSESRINYLARTYDDYRDEFVKLLRRYYPNINPQEFADASVGAYFLDLFAAISDELSYHIDRTYQETNIDSAQEIGSVMAMARSNGFKIPGRKAAIVEVELSCNLPLGGDNNNVRPDYSYAPEIKRGTLFTTGNVTFELMENVNFAAQFNQNGYSNRQVIPNRDSNGNILNYKIKKLGLAMAGETRIYKKYLSASDEKPFLEVTINDSNILGVDSVIVKSGNNITVDPPVDEYFVDEEEYQSISEMTKTEGNRQNDVTRYFEVDSLIDQYRFGDVIDLNGDGYYNPSIRRVKVYDKAEDDSLISTTVREITRGEWKRLKHKFTTEYQDNWALKLTFGAGVENANGTISNINTQDSFTKWLMSRMEANDSMGVVPLSGNTMFIRYRVGGGNMSNIAANTLTGISYLNACYHGEDVNLVDEVRNSLTVTNPTQSYGGKDEPSVEEIKYMMKYAPASQNRCVTLKDYYARINMLPAKYGCPFRIGVVEENNKVVVYALGLNSNGTLTSILSETVADNLLTYLENYRMINDYVEMKSGKVINLKFSVDIMVEKGYTVEEVKQRVKDKIFDYMDIQRHQMGEDIFLGDLQKEISKLDGVANFIDMRCYNLTNGIGTRDYSSDICTQAFVYENSDGYDGGSLSESDSGETTQIDLKMSNMMLYSDSNSMFEVKYKEQDIQINVKQWR